MTGPEQTLKRDERRATGLCIGARTWALLAMGFLGGWVSAMSLRTAWGRSTTREATYEALEEFSEVLFHTEREHVAALPGPVLVHRAIEGMLRSLDEHSHFYTKKEASRLRALTTGVYGGIGLLLERRGPVLAVSSVITNSPAQAAGIRPGDVLVSIDGRLCATWPPERALAHLRGRVGSMVRIQISRKGRVQAFRLTRAVVRLPTEKADWLARGIVYLRVSSFNPGTSNRILRHLENMQALGRVRGIVLDLRDNPGGLVSEAAALADAFLTSGRIFTRWTRLSGETVVSAHPRARAPSVPLVVLVDGKTASAAELLAAALSENGRAVLVGTRTYGKGSIQELVSLRSGALLKLTVGEYLTPSGKKIEHVGLQPSIQPGARLPAPGTVVTQGFAADLAARTGLAVLQDLIRTR